MENRSVIITSINDLRVEIKSEQAFMSLANFLRGEQGLCGTKIICSEGDCGACTVLLANEIGEDGKLKFKSVNSCILPLYLIDGAQVVTVEGLKTETDLSVVQKAMVEHHGAQCGYCTPGFFCSMSAMAEELKSENKPITEKKVRNYLSGNLCRCTGYKPIIEAGLAIELAAFEFLKDRYHQPLWLEEIKKIKSKSMTMTFGEKTIFLPVTIKEALVAKNSNPKIRLIAGSTDVGVVVNKGKLETPHAMALYHITELKKISIVADHLVVGATVTLTEFEKFIEKYVPEISRMLHIFASPQIKNQATLVGNIVNASPIADTIPFLLVMDALVVLGSENKTREIKLVDFYLGYKKLNINPDELVVKIKIPLLKKEEHLRLYKISMRKDLDISAVTFGGLVTVDLNKKITKIKIALGGVGPIVMRLIDIESKMLGVDFTRENFIKHADMLSQFITPLSDLRASKEYRMLLCQNFFKKFFDEVAKELGVN